ncbi:MAG: lipid biosynthesis acyltransferase [Paenibacillaceae bacterium]|jgi:KDO2-lipid IV(A) lauroyltransferase|nr:lipid biosynthesis acyltransferase [Paenibacillaceae bacterium]
MYAWIGRLTGYDSGKIGWGSLFARLPLRLTEWLLRGIGLLLYMFMHRQRASVAGNMRDLLAGAGESEAAAASSRQIRRHVREYFVHAASTLYELLLESRTLPEQRGGRIRIHNELSLIHALEEGKGVILYAPHLGNFFYFYWLLSQRYECLTVATASSPELAPLYHRFQEMGCAGLDYDKTPPLELFRKLKHHLASNGVVLLLGDFYRPSFPSTRLFGKATRGPEGAALLALEQHAPVIPCCIVRESGMNHRIVLEEPLHLHKHYARSQRGEATLRLNSYLETMIRRAPEQWFYWFNAHERWDVQSKGARDTSSLKKPVTQ